MSRRYYPTFPNRTLCDVLSDMRKCIETLNFSQMLSLIEEVQIMANRMEAGLYDKNDVEELQSLRRELKKEIKELEAKKEEFDASEVSES